MAILLLLISGIYESLCVKVEHLPLRVRFLGLELNLVFIHVVSILLFEVRQHGSDGYQMIVVVVCSFPSYEYLFHQQSTFKLQSYELLAEQ